MNLTTIKTITNLGAGTMGHATALQFAVKGYPVRLLDTSDTALQQGMTAIKHDLATFREAGLLHEADAAILARITPTTDYATALADTDFMIESIIEDLDVKKQVWQRVESFVSDETILAPTRPASVRPPFSPFCANLTVLSWLISGIRRN